jgi:hypothetical protein
VTFSRPNSLAGDVLIPAGTIVKTDINALGEEQRFATIISLEMTGLTTNASVEAVVVGTKGNITAGEVTTIESALTDPTITVTNAADFAGGEPEQDDATYREYIRNLIQQLKGATKEAIEAKLLTVPGVEQATVIEFLQTVIEWDDPNDLPIGDAFTIPRVKAFIADANGTANQALIDAAQAAATTVRACGVRIDVLGATPVTLNWTATIALNPSGPNYAELSTDTSMLETSMSQYIQDLEIGDDFVRALANQAMLAIWGPSGTDDLTNFVTVSPSGDVTTAENERLIPGTMDIS